jgi:ATP adenylyltransferase
MERLWAPWRIKYIETGNVDGCIFCVKPDMPAENDAANFIVHRGRHAFVLLNLYPYIGGHTMVAPYKHTGSLGELSDEELLELFSLVRKVTETLTKAFKPDGFNVGMNIGEAAGAGFGDHVHVHVVPRWAQDTNFMPVLTDTRVISEAMEETYERLVKAWK